MDRFEIDTVAEQVHDLESYLAFLELLKADWDMLEGQQKAVPSNYTGSMLAWENTSIGSFLEAAIAGARGNKLGRQDGTVSVQNPWRLAAEIMMLGKLYE